MNDVEAMMFGTTSRERDAAFLRYYAQHVANRTDRCVDIPSVIAATLRGIAGRIVSGHDGDRRTDADN